MTDNNIQIYRARTEKLSGNLVELRRITEIYGLINLIDFKPYIHDEARMQLQFRQKKKNKKHRWLQELHLTEILNLR